jgi:PHD/YefM family antitoxin component YafN of YafNO toxin-antitoxin module
MEQVRYHWALSDLSNLMDQVCTTHEPVNILRIGNDQSVVMLSLADYEDMIRTTASYKRMLFNNQEEYD